MLPSETELNDLDRQLRAHLEVTGAELAAACAQQISNAARIVTVLISVAVSFHACRHSSLQSVKGVAGARVVACLPLLCMRPCRSFHKSKLHCQLCHDGLQQAEGICARRSVTHAGADACDQLHVHVLVPITTATQRHRIRAAVIVVSASRCSFG
jgi:hypothetical protein